MKSEQIEMQAVGNDQGKLPWLPSMINELQQSHRANSMQRAFVNGRGEP